MLTRAQQILLKRAQREAGLSDPEYRDALQAVTGFRTSTAPGLTDRHLDKALAYFEAIMWCAVDAGKLQPACSATAVFRQRDYWRAKNTRQETSRDRFNDLYLPSEIAALEAQLAALGYGETYCAGIRAKVIGGRGDDHSLYLYRAALTRTLKAKARTAERLPITS